MAGVRKVVFLFAVCLFCASCNTNLTTALNDKIATSEKEPPAPGGGGALTAGTPRATVIPLSWSSASDNVSEQKDLQYRIVWSTQNNIDSLAGATKNGTVSVDWRPGIRGADAGGLPVLTLCYLNVLVKDRAGNIAAYRSTSATTSADNTPPSVTSNAIAVGALANDGYAISWSKATDLITPQNLLRYRAYTSKSNNIDTPAHVLANGKENGAWTQDMSSTVLTGLDDDVTYYVNILVEDENNNPQCYLMNSAKTLKRPRIFWTDSPSAEIASTDTSGPPFTVDRHTVTGVNPFAIAVDPVDRKIYWADNDPTVKKLFRSDFDGQNVEDLGITGLNSPSGIAIDYTLSRRYLYWTDATNNKIYRSALPPAAGTADTYKILDSANVHAPYGIDIDLSTGDFFWVENDGGSNRQIRKAPYSTPTSISNIVTGLSSPLDLAVDYVNHVLYWTDYGSTAKVLSHSFTFGDPTTEVINQNLSFPSGITIDIGNGTIYWNDADKNHIYRAPVITADKNANNHFLNISGTHGPQGIQIY